MEEENPEPLTQKVAAATTPAFQRKTEQTHMGIGVQKSMHGSRRRIRRCRREQRSSRELKLKLKVEHIKEVVSTARDDDEKNEAGCVGKKEEEEEDEREEIEKKIEALQRIVPGGEALGVDKLFDETAGYIVALRYQIRTLKALQCFFDKLEKEKTKLGG